MIAKNPLFALLVILPLGLYAQNEPTISTCTGQQNFCLTASLFDLCVEITVDPSFTESIDSFVIDWDDGTTTTIIVGGPVPPTPIPPTVTHTYNFNGFFGTCMLKEDRTVFLFTYYNGNLTPLNNGFVMNVFNPPIASFSTNSPICKDEAIQLNNTSCPTQGLTSQPWDYGDGNTGASNSHTYASPGNYTVTLTVTNQCATATATQQIDVLELPVSNPVATQGVRETIGDTLVVCVSDTICLNGDSLSLNETSWRWDFLTTITNSCFDYIPAPTSNPFDVSNIPNPKLVFFCGGVYRLELTVNNPCNAPNSKVLIFKVVEPPVISFNLNATDCTPTITLNPAEYLQVTGGLTGCLWDFGPLGTSTLCDPGSITFNASTGINFAGFNQCDTINLIGQVTLTASGQAVISSPCPDTLCSYDSPCNLTANLPGGTWVLNGMTTGPVFDPANAVPGLNTIVYGAEPCIQPDTIEIFVIDADVTLSGPAQICIDGGTVTYSGMPSGGIFSSNKNAIDPVTGLYDPAVAGPGPDEIFYELPGTAFCPGMASLEIEVTELAAGFEVTSCNGLSICFSTNGGTSSFNSILWNFGDGQTSSQISPCHTYASANDYPVTVTITNGICQATSSNTVTIEEPPSANFNLSYASPACGPLPISVTDLSTGDNLVYEWNIDGAIVQGQDPGPVVLNNTGMISLTVSNGCGSSSYSEVVEVEPTPTAGFGANTYVCSGDTLEVFNVAILYDQLFWDFGNGQTSTDTGTQHLVYFTALENDTVQIIQIATNGCGPDTFLQNVIVVPTDAMANVTTTAAPLFQVCQNEEVCFESFSQPGGIPLQWDFGDGNTAIGLSLCHAWEAPGVYEVVAKLVSCGFDSTVITVTVLPIPVAAFEPPQAGCPGKTVSFENQSTGAVGHVWDFGDGNTSMLVSPNHVYDSAGIYQVCLAVTSANGCIDTVCNEVNISGFPDASFNVLNPGCQGDNVVFTSTSSPDVISCAWSFGDGNVSAACTATHSYTSPGTYAATLKVTNGNGCIASISENVLVGEVPIPGFTVALQSDCHPTLAIFTNTSQLADGYQWDFGDGTSSTLTNPQHTFGQPGIYTVTLTAITDSVCEAVSSQDITVYETPTAAISLPQTAICTGGNFQFQSNSTGPVSNYEWDFGDGLFSFEQNPVHAYLTPGTYNVVLTVRNGILCQDSDTLSVTVFPPLQAAAIAAGVPCFGDATGIIDVSISSGMAPFVFSWSNGAVTEDLMNIPAGTYFLQITDGNGCVWDSAMVVQQPPVLMLTQVSEQVVTCAGGSDGGLCVVASGGIPAYSIVWENGVNGECLEGVPSGDYVVSLTDANGCLLLDTFEVEENLPIAFTDSVRSRPCFGEDVAFIRVDNVQGGIGGYSVSLEGPDGYFATGNNFGNLEPGSYFLSVNDALGCFTTKNYVITEPDSIWLNVVDDTINLELGADTILFIEHNLSLPAYTWEPPGGLDCTDCPEPLARPLDNIQYRLTMTNANGCAVLDRVFVRVEKIRTVYIPNIFTPNNDGRNDVFRIRTGVKSIEQVNIFQVTNRWGEIVFEAKEFDPLSEYLEDAWDGTFRGEPLPPDVYYYAAQIRYVDGVETLYEGSITLIR